MTTARRVTLRSVDAMSKRSAASAVGAEIRAQLARRSVSQLSLAHALGIQPMSMSRRLRGIVAFDVEELLAIAQLLEVAPGDLLPAPDSYADPVKQLRKRAAQWAPRGSNPQPTDYEYAGLAA